MSRVEENTETIIIESLIKGMAMDELQWVENEDGLLVCVVS